MKQPRIAIHKSTRISIGVVVVMILVVPLIRARGRPHVRKKVSLVWNLQPGVDHFNVCLQVGGLWYRHRIWGCKDVTATAVSDWLVPPLHINATVRACNHNNLCSAAVSVEKTIYY